MSTYLIEIEPYEDSHDNETCKTYISTEEIAYATYGALIAAAMLANSISEKHAYTLYTIRNDDEYGDALTVTEYTVI